MPAVFGGKSIDLGIFAGGIVFGTLLPELKMSLGGMEFNAFWIGSTAAYWKQFSTGRRLVSGWQESESCR